MIFIGISGKIGCGKTTTARKLASNAKYAKIESFGYQLKLETSEAMGFPISYCFSEEGKNTVITIPEKYQRIYPFCDHPYEMTVRQILQVYGTEYRRAQDADYWVKQVDKSYREALRMNMDMFIIDDVRFTNEALYSINNNGYLVRIEPHEKWTPGEHANHVSETQLDNFSKFDLVYEPKYGPVHLEMVANSIMAYATLYPQSLLSMRVPNQSRKEMHAYGCK